MRYDGIHCMMGVAHSPVVMAATKDYVLAMRVIDE